LELEYKNGPNTNNTNMRRIFGAAILSGSAQSSVPAKFYPNFRANLVQRFAIIIRIKWYLRLKFLQKFIRDLHWHTPLTITYNGIQTDREIQNALSDHKEGLCAPILFIFESLYY
jgi:hypothetical protein